VNFTLNEDKRLAKFLKRPLRVASKERESLLNTQNNSKLADLKIIENNSSCESDYSLINELKNAKIAEIQNDD
jgi:hypothetical protein